jgi:hypothetical protein
LLDFKALVGQIWVGGIGLQQVLMACGRGGFHGGRCLNLANMLSSNLTMLGMIAVRYLIRARLASLPLASCSRMVPRCDDQASGLISSLFGNGQGSGNPITKDRPPTLQPDKNKAVLDCESVEAEIPNPLVSRDFYFIAFSFKRNPNNHPNIQFDSHPADCEHDGLYSSQGVGVM